VRVLVVEDEAALADAVARGLRREAMAVDVVGDGAAALERVRLTRYDVVVLDRDLPEVHGDDVCRSLADMAEPPPVLMLTASASVEDRVDGLSLGADDYLPKPFAFEELVARIRALARRPRRATGVVLTHGDVAMDVSRRFVTRRGRPLSLTRKELGVLQVLMEADGAVVSPEDLLERVWDEHADPFTNTVRVTVMTLRRKLGPPPLVETVVGAGYRL
jgi:DNA-binding response OmpR family regulator